MPLLRKASNEEFDSPVERLLASIANLRQQPNGKGAHFYRTSLRRFQAWNDVFHPVIESEQKKAFKFLEKLRKVAGKVRDNEVEIELLNRFPDLDSVDKDKLAAALRTRADRHEQKLKKLLRDHVLGTIWRTLRVLDRSALSNGSETLASIPKLDQLVTSEYAAFVNRRGELTPENLHQYRLQCKRLRYTAELSGTDTSTALVEGWKKVQDAIGEWHDYLMLADYAKELLGEGPSYSALLGETAKKYSEARSQVEDLERKILKGATIPKKKVAGVRSRQRSLRMA